VRRLLLVPVAAAGLALGGSAPKAPYLAAAPKCPVFPLTSVWNERVDALPVAPNSATIVRSIGSDSALHADFGSGLYEGASIGIPITVVGKRQPKSRVAFQYADESDHGPYPIPKNVAIEGGRRSSGDRHAVIVDRDACRLYELYALYPTAGGWRAGSGAIWNLRSNRLRPVGWTSADAAGLPILPGLARYDELRRGGIRHALRFSVQRARKGWVYPARHSADTVTDPSLPPMGLRLRLKASVDTSRFPPQARAVLTTLQRYGLIAADEGASWFVGGAPDRHWSNDQLHTLGRIRGSDFEVVDTTRLPRPR
jgi:hypothetical protein